MCRLSFLLAFPILTHTCLTYLYVVSFLFWLFKSVFAFCLCVLVFSVCYLSITTCRAAVVEAVATIGYVILGEKRVNPDHHSLRSRVLSHILVAGSHFNSILAFLLYLCSEIAKSIVSFSASVS